MGHKNLKSYLAYVSIYTITSCVNPAFAEEISLREFLNQVSKENFRSSSVKEQEKGATEALSNIDLLTTPKLFSDLNLGQDKKPSLSTDTQYQNVIADVGVGFNSKFGLQTKLYTSFEHQKYINTTSLTNDKMDYFSYNLEFKMPLIQNGLGKDYELEKKIVEYQSKSETVQSKLEREKLYFEAEIAYFNLSKIRDEKIVYQNLLDQGRKLVEWTKPRVDSRLLDKSNLTESNASYVSRDLDLKSKNVEYENAIRSLNSLINNSNKYTEVEKIKDVLSSKESSLKLDQKNMTRLELLVQESSNDIDKVNLEKSKEALRPKLDFNTRLSSFAKTSSINDTNRCKNSFTNCSQVAIGLNFEMPLGFDTNKEAKNSLESKINSKEYSIKQARLDFENEYQKLIANIKLIDSQILASKELQKVQRIRLEEERNRQRFGRATTFDVIRAEQDYSQSELALIEYQYKKLELISQLRFYTVAEAK